MHPGILLRSPRYRGRVVQRGRHDDHLAGQGGVSGCSGKFSIRLVPLRTPENVDTLVINYYLSADSEFVTRVPSMQRIDMEENLL
jgi:hypothetical protein